MQNQTTIQRIGEDEHVKLMFDPLKKVELFNVLMADNSIKSGFLLDNEEVILESNANITWSNVRFIIGGFSDINIYKKVTKKINEEK